jgi:hypothetical protein
MLFIPGIKPEKEKDKVNAPKTTKQQQGVYQTKIPL